MGSVHIADPEYYQALEAKVDGWYVACLLSIWYRASGIPLLPQRLIYSILHSPNYSDVVLYEMITSERNVFRDASDPAWPGREQLGVELAATPALRQMALAHGLEPQLDNMRFFGRRHWYLSDISRERLCALQRANGERPLDEGDPEALAKDAPTNLLLARFPYLGEMAQMFWEGFTSRGKVLPKFLSLRGDLSKAPFRLLRLCMWLTPAPELQLMLLDWARQYPPAGGLSKILRSMVGALVHADFLTLRRLAFSQMLTSRSVYRFGGLVWLWVSGGGLLILKNNITDPSTLPNTQHSQGSPPPEVLVLERNSKVVLDVALALEAAQAKGETTNKDVEVAVLYGGLHLKVRCTNGWWCFRRVRPSPSPSIHKAMHAQPRPRPQRPQQDMEEKLVRHLNFTRDAAASGDSGASSDDGGLEWTTAWTMPAYTSTRPALVAALCVALPLLYLGVGAADWSATFGDIAHDIALGGALRPAGRAEAPAAALPALTYEAVREAALYVFRHLALYWGLTRWVVEWERQLFELK